ncbi:MAG: RNA polymerase sigma factor, partial [Desulfobacca sp.]|uniref:RNA polymerase sigma factor n=1 Tax=Desulfobacca sp. TaxID=2067990 RepID=UPI004049AAEB
LRQPQEAEDAVQEVFLKAYQHAGRFQPTGTVAAWLNRITANHCLNLLRVRKNRREVAWEDLKGETGGQPEVSRPDAAAVDPLAALTGQECARLVEQAVAALPENQRQALLLKRFGDFSYQEIGVMLGLSPQAVDGLIKRARQTLRQKLAAYFQ